MLAETYSYLDGTDGNTSYNVTAKAINYGSTNGITYSYTYNLDNPALGDEQLERSNPYNIWQIKEGNTVKVEYSYDLLGRLVRENNAYANATITYTYDDNNNLTSKTTYAYTTGTSLTNGITQAYTYGDTTFKDRLTSYNGNNITYDALGNPLSYMGNTLTWEGRELQSYGSLSFKYDMNGLRSSKGSTDYLYSGNTLIKESNSTHTIYYLYGQSGLIGFELDGVSYYYVRNLLGDVTGVIDTSGNLVVQYAYDSWGKVLSTTGSMANAVGTLNPIRYRGYYYDVETGLYYLQSRYYDPETGRFISPDVIAEGGNIYTYCLNDPVNRSDESGYLSKKGKQGIIIAASAVVSVAVVAVTVATGGTALPVIAGMVVGFGVSAVLSTVNQAINGENVDLLQVIADGAIGMAFGALGGSSINAIGMTMASGILGAGSSIANNWINEEEIDYLQAGISGGLSALIGGLSGGGAQYGKTAQRQAAIQTRKQIIQRNSAGGYRSSSNYKFALNSNKSRIDRLTKNLKIEAISEVLISTYITLDITVYQSLLFG